jgi:hypothetical protein
MSINSTEATIIKRDSIVEKVRRFLFGDDIFISYSRVDSTYALSLANELTKRNLSCFLDQWGTPPGETLPDELIGTIKKCSTMVLIGSKNASDSENVGLEVKEFLETNRPIIPISFVADEVITNVADDFNKQNLTGTLEQSTWYPLIKGIAKTTEVLSALKTRTPSENVILRIVNSVEFRSRSRRLRKTFYTTLGAIIVLLVLAGILFNQVIDAKNQAQDNANKATKLADDKTEEANRASILANTESNRAKAETNRANEQANIANTKQKEADKATELANNAQNLADEKNQLALAKTKLADEQTKIADLETKRADKEKEKADEQTRRAENAKEEATLANDRAIQQEKQAKSNLAENYYNIAQTESLLNPVRAIPWIQKAIDTIPETDNRRAIYNLRALQLSWKAPYFVINTQLNPYNVKFNPDLDKALILSNGASPAMWDLKTGVILSTPWDNINDERGTIQQPSFSPDGKWIAAFYYGLSTDKTRDNAGCFEVWEVANSRDSKGFCPSELDNLEGFGFTAFGKQTPDIITIDFSPDSRALIISYPKQNLREIRVWDIDSKSELTRIPTDILAENPAIPTGIEIIENVTNVRDAKLARRKSKEWKQRNQVFISKNSDNNCLITFKTHENGTTAELREITSGKVKTSMELEKIVDFIGFTGDSNFIITLSHNVNGQKIYRIWNTNTGTRSENPAQWDYDIIAINKTGNKLLLKDKKEVLSLWEWDGGEPHYRFIFHDFDDVEATFSNDEKYIITKSITSENSVEGQWEISVWEHGKGPEDLIQVGSSIKTEDNNFEISSLEKMLGIMSKNGLVSLWNLVPNKEKQIFQFDNLSAMEDFNIRNAIFTPNFILTAEEQSLSGTSPVFVRFDTPKRIQIRSLRDGQVKSFKGIDLRFDSFRPSVDLNRDNTAFLTLESRMAQPNSTCRDKITVRSTENGEEINNFQPICSDFFYQAVFNQSGNKIITISSGINFSTNEIKQWDSATGTEDKSQITEINTGTSGQFLSFTRYGEFVVTSKSTYPSAREFNIRSTDAQKNTSIHFEFSNNQSLTLALSLLKQAKEIKIQDNKSLEAIINSSLNLTLKTANGETSIINNKTNVEIIGPNSSIDEIKLSADGQLLIGKSSGNLQVWETQTGLPITNNLSIGKQQIGYFDFAPDGKNIFAVAQNGQIRSWYIGSLNDTTLWTAGMAEALSGSRIVNNIKIEYILPKDYVTIRQKYMEELNRIKGKNTDAEYLLKILNP